MVVQLCMYLIISEKQCNLVQKVPWPKPVVAILYSALKSDMAMVTAVNSMAGPIYASHFTFRSKYAQSATQILQIATSQTNGIA